MKSCIYKGKIQHSRVKPVEHSFYYRLFMLYLDLEELPSLFDDCRLWSYEKANIASWKRKHYLGPRDLSLRDAVRFRIEEAGYKDPGGPVRMLTQAGYFGLCYNPVTFYYCYDKVDRNLEIIIAEINNTPWNERHAYVLPNSMSVEEGGRRFCFAKAFHVSPFMPMNVDYDWSFSAPGETLNVNMVDNIGGNRYFSADLCLDREELTKANLNVLLLNYPFMTAKIVGGIYWQALKLWIKQSPFYENPSPRNPGEKDFYSTVASAKKNGRGSEVKLD